VGVTPVGENSGDKKQTKQAGSQLCRTALWLWLFTRIETNSPFLLKSEVGLKAEMIFVREKADKPIRLARIRAIAKVATWLFDDLIREVLSN
jgi:hypothetical protein